MEFKVVLPNEGDTEATIEHSDDWTTSKVTLVLGFADDGQVMQVSDGTWSYEQLARALSQVLQLMLREAALGGEAL